MINSSPAKSSSTHNDREIKCVDLPYIIITSIYFIGLLVFAILWLDLQKLYELTIPRDINGKLCQYNYSHNYLLIYGPSIYDRQCTDQCNDTIPNIQLGGICIAQEVQIMLAESGEYQQYIAGKINILRRLKIIVTTIIITFILSIIALILIEFSFCICYKNCHVSQIIISISLIGIGIILYLLFNQINLIVWGIYCTIGILYFIYVVVWQVIRYRYDIPNVGERNIQNTLQNTFIARFLLSCFVLILALGFSCLTLFQYLAFISQSPYYQWNAPDIYSEVNGITYREMLVFGQAVYFVSFVQALRNLCGISLYSSSLGIKNGIYCFFRCFLGSICKLAIYRIIFFVPIFLLTLIKPKEEQKCANCCHCICGLLLNIARKYTLPIFAYQTALKKTMSLGDAANKLHMQMHANKIQYHEGFIQKIGIYTIISCVAIGTVLMYQRKLGLSVNLLTLNLALFFSVWIATPFISSWIYGKESIDVRKICQSNRHNKYQQEQQ